MREKEIDIMSVAKGKLFVTAEQLQSLLGLPEGVEILALRPKLQNEGFEFLLVSTEETVLTRKGVSIGQLPNVNLELQHVENVPFPQAENKGTVLAKNQAQLSIDAFGNIKIDNSNNIDVNPLKQDQKDVSQLFEEIVKNVKVKGAKFQ